MIRKISRDRKKTPPPEAGIVSLTASAMSSNSKWLPAPVALFTDQKRAVRTLPWCLEIGHAPVHPAAHQLTASPASATEPPQQPDPLVGAAIHPDVAVMEAELVADRRWLHTNAELSFEEDATHVFIEQKLRALGLEPTMGLGRAPAAFEGAGGNYHRRDVGTGITADIIGGAGDGPCIALRADIDALPIVETDDSAAGLGGYKSSNIGCMHACGHDAHTAMLLATAAVLVKSSARLKGTIRLIFQPAEEFGAGAKYMVSDGVMEGVDQIYGVHVMNFLETGTIGVKSGPLSECLLGLVDRYSIAVWSFLPFRSAYHFRRHEQLQLNDWLIHSCELQWPPRTSSPSQYRAKEGTAACHTRLLTLC